MGNQRRHFKLEGFEFYTELSQQIEENVGVGILKTAVMTFASEVCHRATKVLFTEGVLNDHHFHKRDVDLTLMIYEAIMKRIYPTVEDLEEYLKSITKGLEVMMEYEHKAKTMTKWLFAAGLAGSCVAFIGVPLVGIALIGAVIGARVIRHHFIKKQITTILDKTLVEYSQTIN